jgi:hypothetical protein
MAPGPDLRLGYNKQIEEDGEMQSIKKGKQDDAEYATAFLRKRSKKVENERRSQHKDVRI